MLGAFSANLVGWLGPTSRTYQGLNALGAAIAAYASHHIDFLPFVVLEVVWCVVALFYLLKPRIWVEPGMATPSSKRGGCARVPDAKD